VLRNPSLSARFQYGPPHGNEERYGPADQAGKDSNEEEHGPTHPGQKRQQRRARTRHACANAPSPRENGRTSETGGSRITCKTTQLRPHFRPVGRFPATSCEVAQPALRGPRVGRFSPNFRCIGAKSAPTAALARLPEWHSPLPLSFLAAFPSWPASLSALSLLALSVPTAFPPGRRLSLLASRFRPAFLPTPPLPDRPPPPGRVPLATRAPAPPNRQARIGACASGP
jgi:hypothetical protein